MKIIVPHQAGVICFCGIALAWAGRAETLKKQGSERAKLSYAIWDTNHDNALSPREIEIALALPALQEKQVATLTSLRHEMVARRIKSLSLEELGSSKSILPVRDPMH